MNKQEQYARYAAQLAQLVEALQEPEESVILEAVGLLHKQTHDTIHDELTRAQRRGEGGGRCPWCGWTPAA